MEGLEAIFRWMHVFAGIIWIGHLYFFNWVNGPLAAKLDGPTKKVVIPELMPRALYWFRWGAAYTWVTGILLAGMVYYMQPNLLPPDASIGVGAGVAISLALILLTFFVYDILWKSLASNETVGVAFSFVIIAVL